jgi:hypothetical protein
MCEGVIMSKNRKTTKPTTKPSTPTLRAGVRNLAKRDRKGREVENPPEVEGPVIRLRLIVAEKRYGEFTNKLLELDAVVLGRTNIPSDPHETVILIQ